MALTFSRASQVASRAKVLADRVKSLRRDLADFLEYNSDQGVDWGAVSKPAYLDEDESGNLQGQDFSRQAMSNVIGTFATLDSTLTAGNMDNVNAVARADA